MSETGTTHEEGEALARDLIIPAIGSGLAIYYLASTGDLAWEARATGTTIAVVLLGLCLAHALRIAIKVLRHQGTLGFGDLFANSLFNRQRVALIVLLVVFVATIRWVGTTLGLFVLLTATMLVMGVRDLRHLLGVAFVSAATVYVLFIYLLNSRMPRGIVEALLSTILPPLGG